MDGILVNLIDGPIDDIDGFALCDGWLVYTLGIFDNLLDGWIEDSGNSIWFEGLSVDKLGIVDGELEGGVAGFKLILRLVWL